MSKIQDKVEKPITLFQSLIPVVILVALLAVNVYVFRDDALSGTNQFILLIGGSIATLVGLFNRVSYDKVLTQIINNVRDTSSAVFILLLVGALSGTWLLSGIIPTMIYYGLQILHPAIYLPACLIITSIISIATGSSWTTSATVGIALVGIGNALGMPIGMIGGAVISGAYFGDKLSPLSDTTNLAPVMAGTDLFTHIRYMLFTTVPTYVVTLIIFVILGLMYGVNGDVDTSATLNAISDTFNVTPILFIVPVFVVFLIVKKVQPIAALLIGTLLGGVFALIFQPNIVVEVAGGNTFDFYTAYKGVMLALTTDIRILSPLESLNGLFEAGGMASMLNTVWLILCAMFFGGAMEAIGALQKISQALLNIASNVFGLFASTVASCLAINIMTSDQYLSIVVPGKMFSDAYKAKGLAPENLSRTLEDSGTVTSVLIPWNTCGAYHSGVLGIPTMTYLPYAFFNYLSPFVTLLYAAFDIKIRKILKKD
ncbi:Na+/H+ antiporter NhaC [Myroides marinus]|uniref:Na+/H+ antiporter NhaC n=1 Tax=Myroides marinus TaxID=703342 RepID=UPI0025760EBE|nr:Na+/H+ antiporter NhaC [Myroides marinus]MDM1376554.1 Na+/H+ antiporter NhaC [Myroides marinus]MDM1391471.1 Na+/H+ antiporter NhaC [Myroides marinus]MDM1405284.1 Na+/H+ antiporter NhaC [Myroides marinus]MDM1533618.1 Na+/H+ antiporter NhaC [Myroides marinus]MDM1540581.1 Na+/H+ antiporter NhaC [Myroides marinus]